MPETEHTAVHTEGALAQFLHEADALEGDGGGPAPSLGGGKLVQGRLHLKIKIQ